MATGVVKWFNDAKGYGFIQPDEGGKDLFVHHTEVVGSGFKSLTEGAKVSFESRDGQKGPEATQVDTIGETGAFKTSTGAEIRFFMPVLNVPFRLIFAMNPSRVGVLDNNLQPEKKFKFRFAVGTTF